MQLKKVAREILPPFSYRLLQKLKSSGPAGPQVVFSGRYPDWAAASADCSGYDASQVLERVRRAALVAQRGEAAYEHDGFLEREIHLPWFVLTGLLLAAYGSRNRADKMNVLDFGGSLGSAYFQTRPLLQHIGELSWNVVEQRHCRRMLLRRAA